MDFDRICMHVGKLYLELEHQSAILNTRIKQLEEDLASERNKRVEAERLLAQGRQPCSNT